jgi:hypothetical protein
MFRFFMVSLVNGREGAWNHYAPFKQIKCHENSNERHLRSPSGCHYRAKFKVKLHVDCAYDELTL